MSASRLAPHCAFPSGFARRAGAPFRPGERLEFNPDETLAGVCP